MKTEYSINYDAETVEEAKDYLKYRYKQLGKFGFYLKDKFVIENNSIVSIYKNPFDAGYYGSVYILKQYREKRLFSKRVQEFMITIVTLDECNLSDFLESKEINHIVLNHSSAYKIMQQYYGNDKTKRSEVPLIYHIEEGGSILNTIGASDIVKDAYYLHPLLQSDEGFNKNKSYDFTGINTESVILAMEYRRVANSYLSTNNIEDFVGFSCEEVKQMLMADKIQNYKDFMLFHYEKHERSNELYQYFNHWFRLLNIDYNDWADYDYG